MIKLCFNEKCSKVVSKSRLFEKSAVNWTNYVLHPLLFFAKLNLCFVITLVKAVLKSQFWSGNVSKVLLLMSATLTEQNRYSHPAMNGVSEVSEAGACGDGTDLDFHAHLQRFVKAKSQIINIYKEMSTYVSDVNGWVVEPVKAPTPNRLTSKHERLLQWGSELLNSEHLNSKMLLACYSNGYLN